MTDEVDKILKQREGEYGEPKKFFKAYEKICNELDGYKATSPYKVEGCQKAIHMIALKTLRLAYDPKHKDSLNDLIGYTKILKDLANE